MTLKPYLTPAPLTLFLLLTFWGNGLTALDRFPKIHEDEAWQAAPGYTFWAEGRFGTDLFAGFYGMEAHYYGFMPLFPLIVGAALHLFGVGLFQARLVPLTLITLSLAVTHRLGTKLFSPWHGTLAVAVLVGWRIAGPFPHLVSGIPLADVARIVRYDSAVPLFGLAALAVFVGGVEALEGWRVGRLGSVDIYRFRMLNTARVSKHAKSAPKTTLRYGYRLLRMRFWSRFVKNQQNLAKKFNHVFIPSVFFQFFLVGVLLGLATLSHLYGAFWLPALGLALVWLRGWQAIKPLFFLGLGFGLTLTPWLLFVASGWQDFLSQSRNYSDRFGLLDIRFYLVNLLLEVERYDPILNGAKQSFGAWLWLIACSLGLGWFLWRSLRGDETARILVAVLATMGTLFALFLSFKTFSYLATLWPLFALLIAAGFLHLWRTHTRQQWWRPLLTALFLGAMLEGTITTWRIQTLARQMTPYHTYTQAVARYLPPASRVMGLQHYWLGLVQVTAAYRNILVPIFWASDKYVPQPLPFAQTAEAIPPDILLLDQIMLDFLTATADPADQMHPLYLEIQAYLSQHQAHLSGVVDDPTYGRMEIYRLGQPLAVNP